MECDIILNVGGEELTIKKEDSLEELSSLQDIAQFIKDNWSSLKRSSFIKGLQRSSSLLTENEQKFMGKPLIGNSSVEQIKQLYPEAREILEKIPNLGHYNITLLNNAYTNGLTLKGRVLGNGIVSYVIRNKYDAINFAKSEYAKYIIHQLVEGNKIINPDSESDSDYLTNKYQQKLLDIKSKHSRKIKGHLKELNPNFEGDITIKHLLEDYLNYKSDYFELLQLKDYTIDQVSVINDFLRELQYLPLYQEGLESPIARRLRSLSYDIDEFGKKDFYETIKNLGTESQKELIGTEEDFINLSLDDLQYLVKELFKDDPILSKYSVKSVEKTLPKKQVLKSKEVKDLINKKNEMLDKNSQVDEKELNTEEGVKEFFGENFVIVKDGVSYKLDVEMSKDKLKYFYYSKKLENDVKIELTSKGRTVQEDFKVEGYDTMSLFHHLQQYKGYHIYEYSPNKNTIQYVVSKSIINPNLFGLIRTASIEDAQQTIDNLIRSEVIEEATNIELKFSESPRTAYIKSRVSVGQALTSRQYPIKNKTKLNSEEYTLFSSTKMLEVHKYYKDTFNIDISRLDDPEKVGIFLYAMTNNELTIENLKKNGVNQATTETINAIIDGIENAKIQHFLVEKNNKDDDKDNKNPKKKVNKGLIYLKYLKDSDINNEGISIDGLLPQDAVKRRSLENVKHLLEEGIFKNTSVNIHNISKEQASTMKNSENKLLFEDIESLDQLQAFVYNNDIYVVVDNANIREMIHETLHIVLGAMRAKDFASYEALVNHLYNNKVKEVFKNQANKYKNFALLDRKEEALVRHLANQIQNSSSFFNTETMSSEDMVKSLYKAFIELSGDIKKAINKNEDWFGDGGFAFPNKIGELLKDKKLLGKMQKNRIATNIIKKGISNGTIKLKGDC